MSKRSFKSTKIACYIGYFVQAIINNLAPLLFAIFSKQFNIGLGTIGSLIVINFVTQMVVDAASIKLIDKIGYKKITVISHALAFSGLVMLGILPKITPKPFFAIAFSVIICAIGSGIIEVTISPIVESIPSDRKEADMSLLHSFYCWGQMAVVALSTLFIKIAGDVAWSLLPVIWSLVPLFNLFNFLSVPFMPPIKEENLTPLRELLKSGLFRVAMVLMLCAGASELAMSQWSSFFAEEGLNVSKFTGDLLGPCLFAVLMGCGRLFYGIYGDKINIIKIMSVFCLLCISCYLTASLSQLPLLSLIACAVTGLSISLFWPGTLSLTAKAFPNGSGGVFGTLALFGDLGCASGPWVVSLLSVLAKNKSIAYSDGSALKFGLGFGCIFPTVMLIGLYFLNKLSKKQIDTN